MEGANGARSGCQIYGDMSCCRIQRSNTHHCLGVRCRGNFCKRVLTISATSRYLKVPAFCVNKLQDCRSRGVSTTGYTSLRMMSFRSIEKEIWRTGSRLRSSGRPVHDRGAAGRTCGAKAPAERGNGGGREEVGPTRWRQPPRRGVVRCPRPLQHRRQPIQRRQHISGGPVVEPEVLLEQSAG